MTCAQCGSAAITDDERPWWRDDLCDACNWRARAEGLQVLIEMHNTQFKPDCDLDLSEGYAKCRNGFSFAPTFNNFECAQCPRRHIISLPGETGEGNG